MDGTDSSDSAQDFRMSARIRSLVNRHGELHLDRERTELLVQWLVFLEQHTDEQKRLMQKLQETLLPLVRSGGAQ